MTSAKGTCFVVMGFGTKTDFESGRTLDLDKSYRNLIKPAVEAAGYACVRADEIVHSGLIDVPMYQQLLAADIVVADLSTSNKNAFYELGIRHALRPFTTIVIAEDGMKAPFDVNHIVVRSYKHLGVDIGYDEVMRFRGLLTDAIVTVAARAEAERVDSPVYRFLEGLVAPALRVMVESPSATVLTSGAAGRPDTLAAADASATVAATAATETHSMLMKQVNEAIERDDFLAARELLKVAHALVKHEDIEPFIVQRLALVTYKSKHPSELQALRDAAALLALLLPETSNDTETLGLWGAVHKRLWTLSRERSHLDQAVRALERGFYLRNDHYNGINLAFLLNVRASCAVSAADAVADFVLARRVRAEVLTICERWLQDNPRPPASAAPETVAQLSDSRYWVRATQAEAEVGLGLESGQATLRDALAAAPRPWMAETTREQVERLQAMLADSPLSHLKAAG